MRSKSLLAAACGILFSSMALCAQGKHPDTPWRGAGPAPCVGSDGGVYLCPPAPQLDRCPRRPPVRQQDRADARQASVVILWASASPKSAPESQVKIPAGAQVIDLSHATVLPGLIDAHTHMFNTRKPNGTTEDSHADRRAKCAGRSARRIYGGARHEHARQRIRRRRHPRRHQRRAHRRAPLSGFDARHCLGREPANPAEPDNPLASAVVRSAEEGRAAVRDQIGHGADWIKLYPAGAYSFTPTGEAKYMVTYPLPVLQAMIDETHRLGKKTGCHVLRRRGAKERHHRRMRHHRARLRPGSGTGQHDGRQRAVLRPDPRPLHRAVHGR